MPGSSSYPLSQLRVLDLSTQIAGPYCAKMLVDAGADVIKIEPPSGDPLRRWSARGAHIAEGESGPLFKYLNASKRSVVLDLETAAARERLQALAADVDLIVESFAPAEARRLGIALERFQAHNPALSLVSITPWGRTGPWADRPATEFTQQAAVGSIAYRGLPERGPVGAGGRIGEWIPGAYAAVGAISAWLSARNTGQGQHVDVSMFETLVLSMTVYHDLAGQFVGGLLPQAIEIPSIERAKDGWIGFCTITGQQWVDFCSLIGRPDIGQDKQYLDAATRMKQIDLMKEAIEAWTRERTVDEIIELASLMRIPVAPIGDGRTLPQIDQFVERGVYVRSPEGFTQPRVPYLLHGTPSRPFGRAPALGEHGEEVLQRAAEARQKSPRGGSAQPLADLRVVDLAAFWAGPVTAAYLADMGADVIKVESIQRPDGMRFAGSAPKEPMWERSAVFHGANTGKRAITLDLTSSEGLDLVKRLIADADVVLENFSARVLENFGLTWEVIHALNPNAIMLRMPAFGLDGPWRDRAGFAMTIEQVSGLAWMTGYEDMPLVVRGACDPLGGMHAVFSLYAALEERRRTGVGQLVEVALIEPALNIAAEQVIEYSISGELLSRSGNLGPFAAPQGCYPCGGEVGWVVLAVPSDAEWQGLRRACGDPEWARDPALQSDAGRRAAHAEIDAALGAWTAGRSAEEVVEALIAEGVPAAAAINGHNLYPNPQLEARDFFQVMDHPVTGKTRYPGIPMRFSVLGNHHPGPPPLLGQHNEEVLRGVLGLSDEEIEHLRSAKVIGNRPTFM